MAGEGEKENKQRIVNALPLTISSYSQAQSPLFHLSWACPRNKMNSYPQLRLGPTAPSGIRYIVATIICTSGVNMPQPWRQILIPTEMTSRTSNGEHLPMPEIFFSLPTAFPMRSNVVLEIWYFWVSLWPTSCSLLHTPTFIRYNSGRRFTWDPGSFSLCSTAYRDCCHFT